MDLEGIRIVRFKIFEARDKALREVASMYGPAILDYIGSYFYRRGFRRSRMHDIFDMLREKLREILDRKGTYE